MNSTFNLFMHGFSNNVNITECHCADSDSISDILVVVAVLYSPAPIADTALTLTS